MLPQRQHHPECVSLAITVGVHAILSPTKNSPPKYDSLVDMVTRTVFTSEYCPLDPP